MGSTSAAARWSRTGARLLVCVCGSLHAPDHVGRQRLLFQYRAPPKQADRSFKKKGFLPFCITKLTVHALWHDISIDLWPT